MAAAAERLDSGSGKSFNGNAYLIWIAACTVICFFAVNLVEAPAELTARFSLDDTFYYLEIAWQTSRHGFVTFDTINHTNGVHFLWFVILLALSYVSPDKLFLLYGTYVISLLLIACIFWSIWRVGTLISDRGRAFTLLLSLLWAAILADRQHHMFVGMEATAHMAALWACVLCALAAMNAAFKAAKFPGRTFLFFTGAAVLVSWTRLDSALFSGSLYLYVAITLAILCKEDILTMRKYLGFSLIIIFSGAAIQFGFYYFSAGTLLPVSGLVKATAIGPIIPAPPWVRYMSIVFPYSTGINESNPWHMAAAGSLFVALLCCTLAGAIRSAPPLRFLYGLCTTLGFTTLLYAAVVGAHHAPYWRWYLSPIFLFYMLAISCIFAEMGRAKIARLSRSKPSVAIGGALISAACLYVLIVTYSPVSINLARAKLGQQLGQNTDRSTIVAAFNAGQLAFFSDRPTINLDGLVNSDFYLKKVLGRPDKLLAYLKAMNVTYLVDYNFYWAGDMVRRNTVPVYALPVIDEKIPRVIRIRQLGRRTGSGNPLYRP